MIASSFVSLLLAWNELESESDAENDSQRGGSLPGRAPNTNRNRALGHQRLYNDYFAENPVFSATQFRRRFRMGRPLFLRILEKVSEADDYFQQRPDATGLLGLSSLQKVTAALRVMAYGSSADSLDENLRMAESTVLLCLKRFAACVISQFGSEYLRAPTARDIVRILTMNAARGFPGMMGSVDCMHWEWKSCPKAWAGMYQGRYKKPTIVLEAVATQDLWIWHAFFGMPGSNNDINVLDRSSLFEDFVRGTAPRASFTVNNREYGVTYLLADGIYPNWSTFVKTISNPIGQKKKWFAKCQEAVRKDVERAFGVLQARFRIIHNPCKLWNADDMKQIMIAAVILHNMIIEDERAEPDHADHDFLFEDGFVPFRIIPGNCVPSNNLLQRSMSRQIRSSEQHTQLQLDLVDHLWELKGDAEL